VTGASERMLITDLVSSLTDDDKLSWRTVVDVSERQAATDRLSAAQDRKIVEEKAGKPVVCSFDL